MSAPDTVLHLRNADTGELVDVPLTIDEHVIQDHAGQVRSVSTSVIADVEGIPGGTYEIIEGTEEPL
ncbi:hypothetical protein HH308_06160 [Gordonia sp. TBRC 11910]|uniref:Uncharacterized protein n=1 Tax=Gordonia asplenii TaxID=2725283 RepID=A0A848KVA4_9ACTN|nr:hypothetical protein [Gordonia asplenii]NMO00795.1 hypothetical protein [Gordonia asplenii]